MLKRLHVENYKTLENFDWKPAHGVSVLIGSNGSGKTAVGSVLHTLKLFLFDGIGVQEAFPDATRTRWHPESFRQVFELELAAPHGTFEYRLEIGFDSHSRTPWVAQERVALSGRPLYDFDGASGRLHASPTSVPIPFSNQRSYLAIVDERTASTTLFGFSRHLARVLVAKLSPDRLSAYSPMRIESESLAFDGSNFGGWYRWFASEQPHRLQAYFDALKGPLPGFVALVSRAVGDRYELRALFEAGHSTVEFSIDELSDGQRQLLILYLMLQRLDAGSVVFLDEPDNFLSLREIQPWLAELDRVAEQTGAQIMLISHQAEAMDYLSSRSAFVFARRDGRGTTVSELNHATMPSEVVLYGATQ